MAGQAVTVLFVLVLFVVIVIAELWIHVGIVDIDQNIRPPKRTMSYLERVAGNHENASRK